MSDGPIDDEPVGEENVGDDPMVDGPVADETVGGDSADGDFFSLGDPDSHDPDRAIVPERRPGGRLPTPVVLAGVAAAMLLVAVIGIVVSGGFRDDDGGSGGTSTTLGKTTTTGPVEVPARPAPDPELASGATEVSFGAGPGQLDPAWRQVSGAWVTKEGDAFVLAPAPPRSLAITRTFQPAAVVGVTLPEAADNAGLVARYTDPRHFLALVAFPSRKAVWLIHVNGQPLKPALLAAVNKVDLDKGVTLGLRFEGNTVDVVVNGVVASAGVSLPAAARTGNAVGLAAAAVVTKPPASFSGFSYRGAR